MLLEDPEGDQIQYDAGSGTYYFRDPQTGSIFPVVPVSEEEAELIAQESDSRRSPNPSSAANPPRAATLSPAEETCSTLRFIHGGRVCTYSGSIFEKLTDPALYTGHHKYRFDPKTGKGKGIAGRESHSITASTLRLERQQQKQKLRSLEDGEGEARTDKDGTLWSTTLRAQVHCSSGLSQLVKDGHRVSHFRNTAKLRDPSPPSVTSTAIHRPTTPSKRSDHQQTTPSRNYTDRRPPISPSSVSSVAASTFMASPVTRARVDDVVADSPLSVSRHDSNLRRSPILVDSGCNTVPVLDVLRQEAEERRRKAESERYLEDLYRLPPPPSPSRTQPVRDSPPQRVVASHPIDETIFEPMETSLTPKHSSRGAYVVSILPTGQITSSPHTPNSERHLPKTKIASSHLTPHPHASFNPPSHHNAQPQMRQASFNPPSHHDAQPQMRQASFNPRPMHQGPGISVHAFLGSNAAPRAYADRTQSFQPRVVDSDEEMY